MGEVDHMREDYFTTQALNKLQLPEPFQVIQGSYNRNAFYDVRGTPLELTIAPYTTVVTRTEIKDAPIMDLKRWRNLYIDQHIVPRFHRKFPQFGTPRIFFFDGKTSWYRMEQGTSLSDTSQFPEGVLFPEPLFKQMIGIFPALAEFTQDKYYRPRKFDEHLQDLGLKPKEISNILDEADREDFPVGNGVYKPFHLYQGIVKGIQCQNPPNSQFPNPYIRSSNESERNYSARILNMLEKVSTGLYEHSLIDKDNFSKWNEAYLSLNEQFNMQFMYGYNWLISEKPLIGDILLDPTNRVVSQIPPILDAKTPEDGDTRGFAKDVLGKFLEENVYQEYCNKYGPSFVNLFSKLGVPKQPLACFYKKADGLHSRPFTYIHCDLHRKNLMVDEQGKLIIMDWEMLNKGDPLYDANDHVMRIRYNDEQKPIFWKEWKEQMSKVSEKYVQYADQDRPVYEMYETIREVIVMTIRCTQAIAQGEMRRDDPSTHRNIDKLVNALNKAGAEYEGWGKARGAEFDSVFTAIEYFAKYSRKKDIVTMRQQGRKVEHQEKMARKMRKKPHSNTPTVIRSNVAVKQRV